MVFVQSRFWCHFLAGNTVSNGVTWDTINSGIVP